MNCIIHNDTPAVGSCGKCGCGICSACVQNSIKADGIDKPVCVNCAVEGVGLYVEYLKTLLKATRTKKIVWTAILLVGAFLLICGFVWRDAMVGHNYVWGFWLGKFIFWAVKGLTRGMFFPFVYGYFMLMGQKDIEKQIAEQQAILDGLIAQKK